MRTFFDQQNMRRANFLSRVFGIFSEEIVKVWAEDERAPYRNLGRPQLQLNGRRLSPIDFTLQERTTGRSFVAEMKCEISYERFKYLTLTNPRQLDHHKKDAFAAFLAHARSPSEAAIRGTPVETHGAILIWGDATQEGVEAVAAEFNFHDVLTISNILSDLREWQTPAWTELLGEVQTWNNDLGKWLEFGSA
jgi:hypothetical protein